MMNLENRTLTGSAYFLKIERWHKKESSPSVTLRSLLIRCLPFFAEKDQKLAPQGLRQLILSAGSHQICNGSLLSSERIWFFSLQLFPSKCSCQLTFLHHHSSCVFPVRCHCPWRVEGREGGKSFSFSASEKSQKLWKDGRLRYGVRDSCSSSASLSPVLHAFADLQTSLEFCALWSAWKKKPFLPPAPLPSQRFLIRT